MKTILTLMLLAGLLASSNVRVCAQPQPGDEPNGPPPDMPIIVESSGTNGEAGPGPVLQGPPGADQPQPEAGPSGSSGQTNGTDSKGNWRDYARRGSSTSTGHGPIASGPMPPETGTNGTDGLVLNFRNAPLDLVLNYLSDAAGFIIILETPVRGNVDVISSHPMTKDEAVDLLNAVLGRNGYAAIRSGRTLTIVNKDEAKTKDIPVVYGSDPDQIPKTDEMVTQILPVRYVDATQLLKDIQPLVSLQTTMTANEAGNSIVMTDTRANIHRVAEIIKAIDGSAEGETEIRVFHLKYANPSDVATALGQIFPSNSNGSSGNNQSPIRFGGPGGGGPGAFFARMAAATGGNNGGQNARVQKQSQVVAVADLRTSSVVVTASKDLMSEIGNMMTQLDIPSTRDQKVFVYHLDNGDPQQALQVLQNMFPSTSTSRNTSSSSSSSSSALMNRETQNASSMGSSSSTSSTGNFTGGNSSRPR
jgi:general secretion pathway protein D